MWSLGNKLLIKVRAVSIKLILVEVEVLEDLVENPKIVHQVGVCTSWVITVSESLCLAAINNFKHDIRGLRNQCSWGLVPKTSRITVHVYKIIDFLFFLQRVPLCDWCFSSDARDWLCKVDFWFRQCSPTL